MKDDFENSLPMLLMRTLAVVMPHFRAIYSAHQITDQQWRVLRVLWQGGSCRLNALAERTLIAAPALVGVVDRLDKRGLVVRRGVPNNRRVVDISVTEAACRCITRFSHRSATFINRLWRGCQRINGTTYASRST